MTSEAVDDQLALALTDWERLLEVGMDLTTSHADCAAINALFGKRIVNLQPTVLVTSSTAVSRNLQRLGKLRVRLVKIGIDGITDSRLVTICEQLICLKTAGHPALAAVHMMQAADNSELLRLKDVEQWTATRLAVHSSFPDAKSALEILDKVTLYELRQLSPRSVASDDLTFLRALELCARIRKNLSCAQYHLIDRIIASKIDALQRSRAIVFSQSTSPRESSSSHPDRAKNQEDDQKTNKTKEQVVVLQSKLKEHEATIRTLIHDKKVMAEDKVALARDKDNLTQALKTLEDRKTGLQQPSSHEREAYDRLQRAFHEERDNHQESQAELLKTKQQLSEAQEDKKLLAIDIEKLKAVNSQLTEASDTSSSMAKVLEEVYRERMRLELANECISTKLEYTEGAYREMARNADKLTTENAQMRAELDKLRGTLAQATISSSGHQNRPSGPDPTHGFLVAENARLETEIAKATGTLSAIMSSLSPHPVASSISLNVLDTASKFDSQTNRAFLQAEEPIRKWDSISPNGPDSRMKTTSFTINTSRANTNTLSQAPSGHTKNYTGNTKSWAPDATILTPSTSVGTDQWSFATPSRAPSPSGSVESEL